MRIVNRSIKELSDSQRQQIPRLKCILNLIKNQRKVGFDGSGLSLNTSGEFEDDNRK